MRLAGSLAVLAAAVLGGCAPAFPPFTAGDGRDSAFKARVADLYRPGTSAGPLRAELAREGFVLLEDPVRRRFTAVFRATGLPCTSQVQVDWTEDRRGRIAEFQVQRHACT